MTGTSVNSSVPRLVVEPHSKVAEIEPFDLNCLVRVSRPLDFVVCDLLETSGDQWNPQAGRLPIVGSGHVMFRRDVVLVFLR